MNHSYLKNVCKRCGTIRVRNGNGTVTYICDGVALNKRPECGLFIYKSEKSIIKEYKDLQGDNNQKSDV